jgi:hypothetical protein
VITKKIELDLVKALPLIFIHNFISQYACYARIPVIGSLFLVVFISQNINHLKKAINYTKFQLNTFNSFIKTRLYAVKPVKSGSYSSKLLFLHRGIYSDRLAFYS